MGGEIKGGGGFFEEQIALCISKADFRAAGTLKKHGSKMSK
jgi:hypothetical protein